MKFIITKASEIGNNPEKPCKNATETTVKWKEYDGTIIDKKVHEVEINNLNELLALKEECGDLILDTYDCIPPRKAILIYDSCIE